MIDIYIRAASPDHALAIAKGAGSIGDEATEIPNWGSTKWMPTATVLEAQGVTITPDIEAMLGQAPFKVFYVPLTVRTQPDDDGETKPIIGTWYALRFMDAPPEAVAILQAQLAAQTWPDGSEKVLVNRDDFPTLPQVA